MKKLLLLLSIVVSVGQINAQCTVLLNFAGTNGSYPPPISLISDGTFLYGTTNDGGANSSGTIFKIMPNGSGYVKLMDFANPTNTSGSSFPHGTLFFDGNYLYGTASYGGTYSHGTIYKIMPNGSGFTQLWIFGNGTDGTQPLGSLISDGTYLYGTTNTGGTNNLGTLFKIMPNGTGYLKILDFSGTANGSNPFGDLIFDGTYLYGTTTYGGTSNVCLQGCGTLFKIKPDGSGFIKMLDFDSINGSTPMSLFYDGTFLYGTTQRGGVNDIGTIYKIKTDGTNYTKLLDFNGSLNGTLPACTLISDGIFLYGTTYGGGVNNMGTAFKIMPDGSNYTKLLDFNGTTNGKNPYTLFSDGVALYGTTYYGGTSNLGVVFRLDGVLGVNDLKKENENLFYPNPTSDQFYIETNSTDKLNVDLFDVNGRHVYSASVSDKENISVATLDNGIYTLTIKTAARIINKKLAIVR